MAKPMILDRQCWHFCPKQGDREGHDWCHVVDDKAKLDPWLKTCPQHRQDWSDIT